ncbi:MAG: hypothetical protein HC884_11915 [Chloroflexaceae bacterium]|nr:hypothetical protein [Chloroflexaceae bacterium]
MTASQLTYQQMVLLIRQLPLTERVRLVREILEEPLEEQVREGREGQAPLESLYGMLAGQGYVPSDEEIRAVRREMWGKFYQ